MDKSLLKQSSEIEKCDTDRSKRHIKVVFEKRYRVKPVRNSQQNLIETMERARLAEYAMYLERPWKLLGMNFLIGLARGLGATIGLGIVLSILFLIAQEVISANLPLLSKWVADLIGMIQSYIPHN